MLIIKGVCCCDSGGEGCIETMATFPVPFVNPLSDNRLGDVWLRKWCTVVGRAVAKVAAVEVGGGGVLVRYRGG